MADYYSILKKTIASLPESNGAARRSVYSRARNAIVNQLKAYEPPLSPSEITAEQLRLEEAIRKVEAEAARESLGLTPAAVAAAPAEPPPVETPESASVEPQPEAVEPSAPAVPETEVHTEPAADVPPPSDTLAEEEIPSPLKETLSEAEALGSAANQAVQNAKEAVETTEASPASEQRQEPVFAEDASTDQTAPEDAAAAAEEPPLYADEPDAAPEPKTRTKRERPRASEALRGGSSSSRAVPISLAVVAVAILLGAGAYFFLPLDTLISTNREQAGTSETQSSDASQPDTPSSEPALASSSDPDEGTKNTDRLLDAGEEEVIAPDARTVTTTTINPQSNEPVPAPAEPAITAGNQQVPALVQPVPVQPEAATPPVPGTGTPPAGGESDVAAVDTQQVAPDASSPAPAGDGAQRSILYEEGEDASGTGTASEGAVVWGFAEEADVDGQRQSVLTASVDIPERDVKVDIRIKPNEDPSLPASHLVEIKYDFPESFAAGDVVNVPGLVMKPTEEARGDALIGASVKVQPGFFWIALSNLPNEQLRNLNLLRERGWIDIPMLYENGKRGILTLEKGADGTEAVRQAVAAWQAG
ncbi:hypothetical protein [Roseibium sp. MMSF_3412]|uniref:hypothetical protein n=1 Tax=Roseibium sp. MMSF_3412 TaxID=3046712 RepID=UPI002740261B|nr:hypothetical protein [Roseibium sp. MMSF_3412]